MEERYITLVGEDVGVIIGRTMGKAGFYKPINDSVPRTNMTAQEIDRIISDAPRVSIPYGLIRTVGVDGNIIWRNRECFDLGDLGGRIGQDYYGRGNVVVEIRDKEQGKIQKILQNSVFEEIGFKVI